MPAPDVQYYLDGSVEAHLIAGDTHYYWMELAQNTNDVVDDYRDREEFRNHWQRLGDMGLYMETGYIEWRGQNHPDRRLPSFMGLRSVMPLMTQLAKSAAVISVDAGHTTFDIRARADMHDRFGFDHSVQLLKRTLNRAAADFTGWSVEDLRGVQFLVDDRLGECQRLRQELIERLREGTDADYDEHGWDLTQAQPRNMTDLARATKAFAEQRAKKRKAIKRSVAFLTKLVGDEKTRVFIGGHSIRIEGKFGIYEIKKKSSLSDSHGGFKALSVFDKDNPDLHLCDICIATDRVPLLDHVSSIILHIQAGEEEEILRIGNARNVAETAYEREWLAPHLPEQRSEEWVIPPLDGMPETGAVVRSRSALLPGVQRQVMLTLYREMLEPHLELLRNCTEAVMYEPARAWETIARWDPAEVIEGFVD